MTRPVILAFVAGCILGLCFDIAREDFKARAADGEKEKCQDGTDTRAYMSRLPGESHTAERCVLMMRYGSPSWVPELSHPLRPTREGK